MHITCIIYTFTYILSHIMSFFLTKPSRFFKEWATCSRFGICSSPTAASEKARVFQIFPGTQLSDVVQEW